MKWRMRNSLIRVNRAEEVNEHCFKGCLNLITCWTYKMLSFICRYLIQGRQNLIEQKIMQHLAVILYASGVVWG